MTLGERKRGRDREEGSAGVIGIMIGIMLFAIVFYTLTQSAVERDADTTVADQATLEEQASSLADVLFNSGTGWYVSTPCHTVDGENEINDSLFDPDGVSEVDDGAVTGRFGLGEEKCLHSATDPAGKNNLSYDKLLNLYNAAYDADDDNGYVDYEEARSSLGLDALGLDFHVRSWPLMSTMRQLLSDGAKDPNMRILYIGDYEMQDELTKLVDHSITYTEASDRITIKLTITNNGTTATIFGTTFLIPLEKHDIDFELHTPLLASGETYVIEVTLYKTKDWEWDNSNEKEVGYEIRDKNDEVGSGTLDLSAVNMANTLLTKTNVIGYADELYWTLDDASETIKMNYMAFEGDGDSKSFSDWTLVTLNPLNIPLVSVVLPNNAHSGTASQTAILEGTHKGQIKNDLLTLTWNYDVMNVVADEVEEFTAISSSEYSPGDAVSSEAYYLSIISQPFVPYVYDEEFDSLDVPYLAGGDIYPDLKDVMNNDLVEALTDDEGDPDYTEYTMLVVGSNVDHSAMTSAAAKNTIRDWVQGGGTLMVFGSDDQSVQWLQPLFSSSLETANGGIQAVDESHPVLHTPNDIDYAAFDYESEWDYTGDADESFTHVVATEGGDLMAVSDAGAFGDGRVLLTSWRPYDLTSDQATDCPQPVGVEDECEAIMLLHNMMTLSYQYLYLDYGPEIPDDSATGTHLRVLNVYHPDLRQVVPMQVQIFVFDG